MASDRRRPIKHLIVIGTSMPPRTSRGRASTDKNPAMSFDESERVVMVSPVDAPMPGMLPALTWLAAP
ncbi:MAG: hypothetical protein GEU91_18995 [Rhizobiales bacterium]|nr:hypothetical protein [Hyphomicrobiales bacterium]